MNAHLSLSHVNQDSTASIPLGLTPAKGTCWRAAEATTPTRRERDASVRLDARVWSGGLSEEEEHFSSKKGVLRLLTAFEKWEFAVCICHPISSWYACTTGCCTDVLLLHGVPPGTPGDTGFDCVWDLLVTVLEWMCSGYFSNSCCQSKPQSFAVFTVSYCEWQDLKPWDAAKTNTEFMDSQEQH